MNTNTVYLPILKGKQGELWALKELDSKGKALILPLFETPPVAWDFASNCPKKSLEAHLKMIHKNYMSNWGKDHQMLVDMKNIDIDGKKIENLHSHTFFYKELHDSGVQITPVTNLDRSDEYQALMPEIVKICLNGLCIRIELEDLEDIDTLQDDIHKLLSSCDLDPNECDILIDIDHDRFDLTDSNVKLLLLAINNFPHLTDWRTFTLASSSFPSDLQNIIKSSSEGAIKRRDWELWSKINNKKSLLARMPIYGDYGIECREAFDNLIDMSKVDPCVNIRYTLNDSWLVIKLRQARKHGHAQFHDLCKDLVSRSEYYGKKFSCGDTYINNCANNDEGPGNSSKWRQAGTAHHLAVVLNQLSTLTSS